MWEMIKRTLNKKNESPMNRTKAAQAAKVAGGTTFSQTPGWGLLAAEEQYTLLRYIDRRTVRTNDVWYLVNVYQSRRLNMRALLVTESGRWSRIWLRSTYWTVSHARA